MERISGTVGKASLICETRYYQLSTFILLEQKEVAPEREEAFHVIPTTSFVSSIKPHVMSNHANLTASSFRW